MSGNSFAGSLMWWNEIELLSDSGKGQQPFTDRQKYLDILKVRAFGFPERSILEGQFGTKADVGDSVTTTGTHSRQVLATAGDGLKVYIRNTTSTISTFTITRVTVREMFRDVDNPSNDTEIELRLNAINVTAETGAIV